MREKHHLYGCPWCTEIRIIEIDCCPTGVICCEKEWTVELAIGTKQKWCATRHQLVDVDSPAMFQWTIPWLYETTAFFFVSDCPTCLEPLAYYEEDDGWADTFHAEHCRSCGFSIVREHQRILRSGFVTPYWAGRRPFEHVESSRHISEDRMSFWFECIEWREHPLGGAV